VLFQGRHIILQLMHHCVLILKVPFNNFNNCAADNHPFSSGTGACLCLTGVEMPNPSASGRDVCRRTRFRRSIASSETLSRTPVTPITAENSSFCLVHTCNLYIFIHCCILLVIDVFFVARWGEIIDEKGNF